MSLKVIAEQWLERKKIESCTVARPRECNPATLSESDATISATRMQPTGLKALCEAKLKATRTETVVQLLPKNDATFDAKNRGESCSELQPSKPHYPSIWDVTIQTDGKLQSMVVIDPSHEEDATFRWELVERFGAARLLSAMRRGDV